MILRSRVDETKTWTGTIEKIDTENKQANNNNTSYDGSILTISPANIHFM